MNYTWKKFVTLSLTVCILGIVAAGCGSAPAAETGTKMDAPALTVEEINEPAMTDKSKSADDKTNAEEADNSVPANDQTDTEPPAQDSSDNSAEDNSDNSTETQNSGKWKVYDPDVAAAVDADFEGNVYKIEADSFFIVPTETWLEENGAIISTSLSPGVEIPDEDLVQVTFDDNTAFILRDIYDGGERHEDSDASFQNIEKEVSVALKGTFQNDVFCADQIRIIKVH